MNIGRDEAIAGETNRLVRPAEALLRAYHVRTLLLEDRVHDLGSTS